MNIRGMDPAALAAAADLFVVAAPQRDDSSNEFRRALQPPAPPRCGTPSETKTPSTRQEATAERKPVEREETGTRSTQPNAEQQNTTSDQPTHVTDNKDGDPQAEVTATAAEDVPAEEIAEENVAAESMAAAANQIAVLVPGKSQPNVTSDVAAATQPVAAEESAEVAEVTDLQIDIRQNEAAAPIEQPTTEQAVPEATTAEAVAELTPELPEPIAAEATDNSAENSAGVGILPSAVVTTTNPTTAATRPATNARVARTAQDRSDGSKQATGEVASTVTEPTATRTELAPGSQMAYHAVNRDKGESKQSSQPDVASVLPIPTQVSDAPAMATMTNDSAVNAPANQATNELAATPAAGREAPAIQPGHSNVTAAIINRLPAQALIRHTQSAAQESAPLHVDAARFLQRVSKAFDSARERGGEIRLRLSPPELGALRVEVNMQDQGLVARLEVETTEARTVLLENLPALRERLAEQGLRLEKFDVELSQREPQQQGGHLPDQPRDRNAQAESRATKTVTARPTAANTSTSFLSPASGLPDRQLNVIV